MTPTSRPTIVGLASLATVLVATTAVADHTGEHHGRQGGAGFKAMDIAAMDADKEGHRGNRGGLGND